MNEMIKTYFKFFSIFFWIGILFNITLPVHISQVVADEDSEGKTVILEEKEPEKTSWEEWEKVEEKLSSEEIVQEKKNTEGETEGKDIVKNEENLEQEAAIEENDTCVVKENYNYKWKNPAQVANALCGNWDEQKEEYAEFLWIENYSSTMSENLEILEYMVENKELPLKKAQKSLTLTSSTEYVAQVWETGYDSLQNAIASEWDEKTILVLKDTTEDIVIPAWKTITLQFEEWIKLSNNGSHTITNNGSLIINGNWTVDNTTNEKASVYNNTWWILTINAWNFLRSQEAWVDKSNNGWNSYYTVKNIWIMTINWWNFYNSWAYSSMFANGYYSETELKAANGWETTPTITPKLTINAWTFDGGLNTVKNDDFWVLEVNGGVFTNQAQTAFQNHNIAIINWWEFTPKNSASSSIMLWAWGTAANKWEIEIITGSFKGWISLQNENKSWHALMIKWGIFEKIGENEIFPSIHLINTIIQWWIFAEDPKDYVSTGYTVVKNEDSFIVESLKEASEESSNTNIVQVAEKTTITTWSTDPIKIEDIETYFSWAIQTWDEVIPEITTATITWEILDANQGYVSATLQWAVSLDFWANANFSNPIAIRIPVNTTSNVRVKVRHEWETFWYTGLTLEPKQECIGGIPGTLLYSWEWITPINKYAIIYTCSASTFVAYTETTPSYSGWGSGGGRRVTSTTGATEETKTTTRDSEKLEEIVYDWINTWEKKKEVEIPDSEKSKYTDEELAAYKWAYEEDITTISNIKDARLREPITRAELAKMMTMFAVNVFWRDEVVEQDAIYPDVDSSLWDLEAYIHQAYRLQIMGINADGSQLENFLPNDLATRAEFATVFSRVLFGNRFNQWWDNWFAQHLYILKKAKVLNNNVPQEKEIKMNVILTLYRIHGLVGFTTVFPSINREDAIEEKKESTNAALTWEQENTTTWSLTSEIATGNNKEITTWAIENETNTGSLITTGSLEKNENTTWATTVIETANEDDNPLFKLKYDGVLFHMWFNESDYKQTLVQYAYKLWGLDFVYMLECENGNRDIHAIGDSGHSYWLCQINDRWHKNFPSDFMENWIVQIEYCYQKRTTGTKFYWPSRIVHWTKCEKYVRDRFTFVG